MAGHNKIAKRKVYNYISALPAGTLFTTVEVTDYVGNRLSVASIAKLISAARLAEYVEHTKAGTGLWVRA